MSVNLPGVFHLGRKHLARQRSRVALLVAAISLSLFLPLGVALAVRAAERHLRARSEDTPLLLGSPGSALELAFHALYFHRPDVPEFPVGEARRAEQDSGTRVIPLHARFQARGHPVVGTTLEYFRFRGLEVGEGRMMGTLGDCVLGAAVARELGLGPGDRLASSPRQLFDLAGVYPLRMRVTGVLRTAGTPDDRAVFCDLKTAWVMEGISHGHEEAASQEAGAVLEKKDGVVALDASIREFQEVTPENRASFHFHGDPDSFPVTAAIILPPDSRMETILLGRYRPGGGEVVWMHRPEDVLDELFGTLFRIRDFVVGALGAVAACAVAVAGLVFALSNRLREEEFRFLANLGAPRGTVRALVAFEALAVAAGSLALVAAGTAGLLLGLDSWLVRLTG
jgi:putative ABC transport system permease protein